MDKIGFSEWLKRELEDRKINQADFARASGISPAQLNRILNNQRSPGVSALEGVARGLRVPPEFVFRAAGLLPAASQQAVNSVLMEFKLNELTAAQINEVLEFIKFIQQRDKRLDKYPPPSGLYERKE